MVDVLTPEQRSRNMSRIRSRDTKPEMIVRRLVHRLGFRYRLHRKDLPGRPDLVFAGRRKIVFVHGCYWHKHECAAGRVVPKTRTAFWETKRQQNVTRDSSVLSRLKNAGWSVFVVWECEVRRPDLVERVRQFLR